MWVTTLPELCLKIIGFFVIFFMPFAILIAAVIRNKIRLTPFRFSAGVSLAMAFDVLIMTLADPRSRQHTWLTAVAVALVFALLAALLTFLVTFGQYTRTKRATEEVNAQLAKLWNKSRDSEEEVMPTKNDRPS